MNRARSTEPPPPLRLAARGRTLVIKFPRGWLKKHPMTAADLEQERAWVAGARFTLRFS
jgi:exopolyphosphatase/guanosine-5'-triphosphate,3'-diphosphate pyrophosphatase